MLRNRKGFTAQETFKLALENGQCVAATHMIICMLKIGS